MTVTARGLLFWPLRPLWRLFLRVVPVADPWERLNYRVPAKRYGPGSIHDFAWYFEGASGVATSSVEDIQEWLLGCEYVSDPDLFRVADYWQHPRTFEQIRRGDCEDHAIWAWRKLIELAPRPNRVILAIAAPDLLERPRMLPVVRNAKQIGIGDVLAAEQPFLNVVDARRRDAARTLEVPGEIVDRSRSVSFRGHAIVEPFPRITDRHDTKEEPPQRPQRPEEQSASSDGHGLGDRISRAARCACSWSSAESRTAA